MLVGEGGCAGGSSSSAFFVFSSSLLAGRAAGASGSALSMAAGGGCASASFSFSVFLGLAGGGDCGLAMRRLSVLEEPSTTMCAAGRDLSFDAGAAFLCCSASNCLAFAECTFVASSIILFI